MEESMIITEDIFDELIMEGYNHDEIEEAITWIEAYQKNIYFETYLDSKESYREILCSNEAYNYATSLLKRGIITENYAHDLFKFILFSHDRVKLTIWDMIASDNILRFYSKEWAEEALANYKAFNLKKDC